MNVLRRMMQVLLLAVVVSFGLTGCATTARLKSDLSFKERESKIPCTVGLYVSPEAKAYVAQKTYTTNFKIPLGGSLEPNAQRALGKVFDKVVIADKIPGPSGDKIGNDYTISLQFDKGTNINLGALTFCANNVEIDLLCEIYDRDGKKIWSKNISAKASKASAMGVLCVAGPVGGIVGNAGYIDALKIAGENATQQTLEKLNDTLIVEKGMFVKK